MSKRILKLWFPASMSRAKFPMPVGSKILDVKFESNDEWEDPHSVCVWIEGDKDQRIVQVRSLILDTGQETPSDLWMHTGTCYVPTNAGPYVRHLYMFVSDLALVEDGEGAEDEEWPS